MNYPLNPTQKRIIKESGRQWQGGDDNDFSCMLATIMLEYFMKGREDMAWSCFQNDPLAVDGVSYDEFCTKMKETVEFHRSNQSETHSKHETVPKEFKLIKQIEDLGRKLDWI